jgi:hypothetical protein
VLPLVWPTLLAVGPHGIPAAPLAGPASRPNIKVRFMTIPPELEAQILRYYHVEKWRVGTIARQLHVHYGTVTRVLAQACPPSRAKSTGVTSAISPSVAPAGH